LRRVPIVQTVASPPRRFARLSQLLFGDAVVVQSRATRGKLLAAAHEEGFTLPPISVIPPPVPELAVPDAAALERARAELGVAAGSRLVLYPGDLEVSSGAEVTRSLVAPLVQRFPDVVVVFAYRNKTPAAGEHAARLRQSLSGQRVVVSDRVSNMHALLAASEIVIFPVDDLWGKVDQPIVLLESLALGVPCVVLDQGPLRDIAGASKVATIDAGDWLTSVSAMLASAELRARHVSAGRAAASAVYASGVVAKAYEAIYLEVLQRRRVG
jgi:phosphatidylinositol alpha-1,6-mannosyltransferase